ncbi:MAG: hypothetical protein WBR35_20175, partial [Anaerolineae bacterium]
DRKFYSIVKVQVPSLHHLLVVCNHNAKTPGRKDAKDIRESAAHSRVIQLVNSFCHEFHASS